MGLKVARVVLATLVFASAGRMSAHHSVPVNFDQTRDISIEGVLTQILWVNPHAHFRIDVMNPDGTKVEWLVEMGASNTMKRAGFPMDRFAVGDRIIVIGAPGRRDRTILLEETVLKDGTHLTPTMRPRTPNSREAQQGRAPE